MKMVNSRPLMGQTAPDLYPGVPSTQIAHLMATMLYVNLSVELKIFSVESSSFFEIIPCNT